jgi:lysophospholipase L1-like esterase
VTVHLAGDSTVAPAKPEEAPLSGWGEFLADYLDEPVRNLAVGGATTDSFVAEGRWGELLAGLRRGDTVVMQFGHNDQKRPELAAHDGYRRRLEGFIAEVRAAGAVPVLATSVERRLFDGERVRHSHGAYPEVVRRLGHDADVPVIDLNVMSAWLYEWLGDEASVALFVDTTHFGYPGARAIAAFVARSLAAIRGVGAELPALGRQGVLP